ncbi:MAG TPA: hypothetical protein PKD49_12105 [Hyphomicrobium sp.]|nr:hypothetical protein [Hyphomicrobium sp.]
MSNIKKLSLAATMAGLMSIPALAEPTKLWEVSGLAGPECALPDSASGTIYVSNVNGDAMKKDGNGFIAKVSLDGKSVDKDWSTGLNAPKGLAISNGHLFVGDVDELVEIDLANGKIIAKHKAEGAGLLNDVAADSKGNVYVTDTGGGGVYKLSGGKIEKWLTDPIFAGANGIIVEGDNLIVNTWGVLTGNGFETSSLGRMVSVSLADGKFTELDGGKTIGNLDGLASLGGGNYLISDWMAGKVMTFATGGKTETILEDGQGTADFGYDAAAKIMYLPQMMKGTLTAYKLQ